MKNSVGTETVNKKRKNLKKHSLTNAIADGAITAEAALCGLSAEDVERLSMRYAEVLVRVNLRTAQADGSTVMPIANLARWTRADDSLIAAGRRWKQKDIKDVFPVSLTTNFHP